MEKNAIKILNLKLNYERKMNNFDYFELDDIT